MAVYILAQITIHDRALYDRYSSGFMPVLGAYGGRLLAAVEGPELLEGEWPYEKVIMIEFTDRAAAMSWLESEPYTTIARDRIAATTGVVILAQGLEFTPALPASQPDQG